MYRKLKSLTDGIMESEFKNIYFVMLKYQMDFGTLHNYPNQNKLIH